MTLSSGEGVSDSKLLQEGARQESIPETPAQDIDEIPEIPAEVPTTEIPDIEN